MDTIIEYLRDVLGTPNFYVRLAGQTNYTWDYGAIIEYIIAGTILCISIAAVLKVVVNLFGRR